MNPTELCDPVFPLMGSVSTPRALHAPRLIVRPMEVAFGERIFPGAWSAQHLPRHRRTNALLVEHNAGADALRGLLGEDGCIYSGPASDGMPIIVV